MSEFGSQDNKIVLESPELHDGDNKLDLDRNLIEHVSAKDIKNEITISDIKRDINENEDISRKLSNNDELAANDNNINQIDFKKIKSDLNSNENEENQNVGDVKSEKIEQSKDSTENQCDLDGKDIEIHKVNNMETFHENQEIKEIGDESVNITNNKNESSSLSKDVDINQNFNKHNLLENAIIDSSVDQEQHEIKNSDNDDAILESSEKRFENTFDNLAQNNDNIDHKDIVEETKPESEDVIANTEKKTCDNSQSSILMDSNKNLIANETADVNVDKIKGDDKISDAETFIDILGNGLLTKKIICYGLGRETRPTHGDSVTIQYRGWNSSGVLIEDNEATFVLGDGDMIQAFDLGICLAEKHEEFELKTDARFAYGTYGWEPNVQPNEALLYRIKLINVDDPPDYTTFTYQTRMGAADSKRERGNYLYRREEYSLAVNSYSRAIKIIQTDPDYKKASTDPSRADMYDLFVKVTNNLAAAQLKLESYDNVIETCNTILNYDASNVKALFRKGKSLTMKGNYDEALPILKRALELENSKLIAGEIHKCYQLKRADDEQRARVCRKMFGTGTKDSAGKSLESGSSSWKEAVIKYSPYIGAVIIAGIAAVFGIHSYRKV